MSTSSSGARRAAGWVSCCLAVAFLGCSQSSPSVTLKLPAPRPSRQALGGSPVTGAAQFDAPIVDPNTWSGTPVGTGGYTVATSPTSTGGPSAIAASDNGYQYVIIGDFTRASGTAVAVVSDLPWVAGATVLDGVHRFAVLFDVQTGYAIAEADSGTLTLSAAGSQLGQRVTGTLSGSFVDVSQLPPPGCQTNADCARGETCQSGVCVATPTGCTSNAQCAAGQVCQSGQCVTPPPPACVVDSDCAAGLVCQAGVCVAGPAGCTSNLQCPNGFICQAGRCVSSMPVTCGGQQGAGGYSGAWGGVAQCSAAGLGSVAVSNGQAWIDDSTPQLTLVVADPSSSSAGVVIALPACPSAAGAVALQPGEAALYAEVSGATPDTALWVAKQASGGTLTFTSVGAVTAGHFQLTFSGGGTVTGSFTVQ
ncbi:MAG: hypothetical protein AB1730_17405 [Myxococcota bacterium]